MTADSLAAARVVDFSAAAGYVVEIGEKIPVTIGSKCLGDTIQEQRYFRQKGDCIKWNMPWRQ